jgi:hypothetical protein
VWLIHTVREPEKEVGLWLLEKIALFKIGEAQWIAAGAGSYELHADVLISAANNFQKTSSRLR